MEELHAKATSVAAKFLERRGYEVLGTEIDTDAGIVDILAIDDNEDIVLVDVTVSASPSEGHHLSSTRTAALNAKSKTRFTKR